MRGAFGWPAPAFGAAIAACAAVYAVLLARLRRYQLAHPTPPWWFGYARDGANLIGVASFLLGFRLAGFAAPAALVLAAALMLACYLTDWLVGRRLGWTRAPVVVALLGAAGAVALTVGGAHTAQAVEALLAVAKPR